SFSNIVHIILYFLSSFNILFFLIPLTLNHIARCTVDPFTFPVDTGISSAPNSRSGLDSPQSDSGCSLASLLTLDGHLISSLQTVALSASEMSVVPASTTPKLRMESPHVSEPDSSNFKAGAEISGISEDWSGSTTQPKPSADKGHRIRCEAPKSKTKAATILTTGPVRVQRMRSSMQPAKHESIETGPTQTACKLVGDFHSYDNGAGGVGNSTALRRTKSNRVERPVLLQTSTQTPPVPSDPKLGQSPVEAVFHYPGVDTKISIDQSSGTLNNFVSVAAGACSGSGDAGSAGVSASAGGGILSFLRLRSSFRESLSWMSTSGVAGIMSGPRQDLRLTALRAKQGETRALLQLRETQIEVRPGGNWMM
ncbi:unnamed protein product, partial [Protopolystoma xenopodis]